MKQFFKFMFASMLGFFLMLAIGTILFFGMITAIVSSSNEKEVVRIADNSVLHIEFKNAIKDRPSDNPFENFDFNSLEDKTPLSLGMIIKNIKKAKHDDKIKGIYLDVDYLQANLASVEEIREALEDFKTSGKFIVSYSENYDQKKYFLNSVADEVYLNPVGDMSFKGLSAQVMFFKDMLNRIDVDMQVIRHGKFKSAIEPFVRDDMSDANREQYSLLVNSIWGELTDNISNARNIDVAQLNKIADELMVREAEDAKELGLVDELMYEDEVMLNLKEKVGLEEDDKLKLVTLGKYKKVKKKRAKKGEETEEDTEENKERLQANSKNRIAVIYAEGDIVSGESNDGSMGSTTIAEAIRNARKDDKVKAIVLRVNSPGGSALASDVIWRETILAQEEKPLVVSMGGVAASGGYYISCAADKIYAENTTITGSIGVFGLIPNMQGMFNNKLGINIDRVNTNTYADGLTAFRPLEAKEREAIQESIEKIYDDFTQKVADGRNMTQEEVDKIGQGRVWTGIDAKERGLVDEIGGLEAAINAAADLAELEDYKIKTLPASEDPFEKIMKGFAAEAKVQILGEEIGKAELYYNNIKQVLNSNGVYTRLPVELIID